MRRRDVVRGGGTLVALALAGCTDDGGARGEGSGPPEPPPTETTVAEGDPYTTTSPTPDPAPNLIVHTFTADESDEGNLVIPVDVRNVADEASSAVLVVSVTVAGETYDRERVVTVEGNETTTFEFEFPVTPEEFRNDGALDFAWREAPEE